MTKDSALRMALEALEYTTNLARFLLKNEANIEPMLKADKAITAIKEALAQPEHEPVAWLIADGEDLWVTNEKNMMLDYPKSQVTPLYTTPPHPIHRESGMTSDELWLSNGKLRAELADLKVQRKPLTDEQRRETINSAWNKWMMGECHDSFSWYLSQAIEAAHGIKE